MSNLTEHLQLPFLLPSQAQKHVTHNEALEVLDRLTFLAVLARETVNPPASPESGNMWIAGTDAQQDWEGKDGQVALFNGSDWVFQVPRAGWLAFVMAEMRFCYFDGAQWLDLGADQTDNIEALMVSLNGAQIGGSTLSVHGSESRFVAKPGESDDIRLMIEKTTEPATASLIFQTGAEGRAEIGLAGDDDMSVRVSSDGSSWIDALRIDHASGMALFTANAEIGGDLAVKGSFEMQSNFPNIVITDSDSVGNAHTTSVSLRDATGEEKAWFGLGSGSNSAFTFLSHYPDGFSFNAYGGNYPIDFLQNGASRLRIHTNGYVGIDTASPTAHLHVGGAVRLGSYAAAALPSASTFGAGSVIFVGDGAGGPALVFSDGTGWRRADTGNLI